MCRAVYVRLESGMAWKFYLDESLRQFETVYPAAGDDHSAVRLSVDELEQIAGAKGWVDVCKEA